MLGILDRDEAEDAEVLQLAVELNGMGVSLTHPNPYFEAFAKARARQVPPPNLGLSKEDLKEQARLADEVLLELENDEGGRGALPFEEREQSRVAEGAEQPKLAGDDDYGAAEPT